MRKGITIYLMLMALFVNGRAQDASEDLKKINRVYQDIQSFYLEGQYHVFRDHNSETPLESMKLTIKKSGNRKYTKVGTNEIVVNDNYTLLVNHADRIITLDTVITRENTPDDLMPLAIVDSMLGICRDIQYLKMDRQYSSYIFRLDIRELKSMKLVYDHHTYYIKSIILYFRDASIETDEHKLDAPRAQIDYRVFIPGKEFGQNEFSGSKFFQEKKGKYVLTPAYTNYKFINHL